MEQELLEGDAPEQAAATAFGASFQSLLEPEDVLLYAADERALRGRPPLPGVTERWQVHLSSAIPHDVFEAHVRLNLMHRQQLHDEGHMVTVARSFGEGVRARAVVKAMVKDAIKHQKEWVSDPTAPPRLPSPASAAATAVAAVSLQRQVERRRGHGSGARSRPQRQGMSFGLGKVQGGDGANAWLNQLRGSFGLRKKQQSPQKQSPAPGEPLSPVKEGPRQQLQKRHSFPQPLQQQQQQQQQRQQRQQPYPLQQDHTFAVTLTCQSVAECPTTVPASAAFKPRFEEPAQDSVTLSCEFCTPATVPGTLLLPDIAGMPLPQGHEQQPRVPSRQDSIGRQPVPPGSPHPRALVRQGSSIDSRGSISMRRGSSISRSDSVSLSVCQPALAGQEDSSATLSPWPAAPGLDDIPSAPPSQEGASTFESQDGQNWASASPRGYDLQQGQETETPKDCGAEVLPSAPEHRAWLHCRTPADTLSPLATPAPSHAAVDRAFATSASLGSLDGTMGSITSSSASRPVDRTGEPKLFTPFRPVGTGPAPVASSQLGILRSSAPAALSAIAVGALRQYNSEQQPVIRSSRLSQSVGGVAAYAAQSGSGVVTLPAAGENEEPGAERPSALASMVMAGCQAARLDCSEAQPSQPPGVPGALPQARLSVAAGVAKAPDSLPTAASLRSSAHTLRSNPAGTFSPLARLSPMPPQHNSAAKPLKLYPSLSDRALLGRGASLLSPWASGAEPSGRGGYGGHPVRLQTALSLPNFNLSPQASALFGAPVLAAVGSLRLPGAAQTDACPQGARSGLALHRERAASGHTPRKLELAAAKLSGSPGNGLGVGIGLHQGPAAAALPQTKAAVSSAATRLAPLLVIRQVQQPT